MKFVEIMVKVKKIGPTNFAILMAYSFSAPSKTLKTMFCCRRSALIKKLLALKGYLFPIEIVKDPTDAAQKNNY